MNYNEQSPYRISGQSFDLFGLKSFCLEKISVLGTPLWEREIWSFILQWLDTGDAIQVQTSGSTGKPKNISLQKKYMIASAKATLAFFELDHHDSALLCLPVKYIAGKMMIIRALVGGMELQFVEPSTHPDLTEIANISFAAMTPMQLVNSLAAQDSSSDLEKIKTLIVGGAALPPGLEPKLEQLKTTIWQTYGMTETITHIALRKVNGDNSSEWYQCLPGVTVVQNADKCLEISCPGIGIEKLVTNDIVDLNSDSRFKVLGRTDNVVNSGGVKLFPEVIEQKLQSVLHYPFFLSGLTDEILGERLVLFIESDHPQQETIDDIWLDIKSVLSGYEIPKEIIFKKEFKRTLSGKIIRK